MANSNVINEKQDTDQLLYEAQRIIGPQVSPVLIMRTKTASAKKGNRYVVVDPNDTSRVILSGGFKSIEKAIASIENSACSIFDADGKLLTIEERRIRKRAEDEKSAEWQAVGHAIERIRRFRVPPYAHIEPLAEYICRTLFDNHGEIHKHVSDLCDYDCSGTTAVMNIEEFADVVRACLEGEKSPHERYEFESHILSHLYTGACRASYCSGCGWFFDSYLDGYQKRAREIAVMFYGEGFVSPYAELSRENYKKYYDADIEDELSEKQMDDEYAILTMFNDYLKAQGWKRFVPRMLEIIGRQRRGSCADLLPEDAELQAQIKSGLAISGKI